MRRLSCKSSNLDLTIMDLSIINLACIALDPSTCADIICGSNGLPLAPNSIQIVGKFKAAVEYVDHPNLTKYVECFRNKNERVTLVFEELPTTVPNDLDFKQVSKQLFDALSYLHQDLNCVHGLITSQCFVWTKTSQLKLAHWPINLLTLGGYSLRAKTLLPLDLSFVAPENVKVPGKIATQESDIWSAGLALLKIVKPDCKLPDNPCRLAFCDNGEQVIECLEGKLQYNDSVEDSEMWNKLFVRMLEPDPTQRATITELCDILGLDQPAGANSNNSKALIVDRFEEMANKITKLDISEIYYLWRLSMGRNFESEQKQRDGCSPIFKIPYLIVSEKLTCSPSAESPQLQDYIIIDVKKTKPISLDLFRSRIERLDERILHPLLLTDEELLISQERKQSNLDNRSSTTYASSNSDFDNISGFSRECCNYSITNNSRKLSESFTFADLDSFSAIKSSIGAQIRESSRTQPIVIKEADFAYQCERVVLFKRLIACCPYLNDQLRREASIDIPPYYRAQTWAILLNVSPTKSKDLYESIDKTTPVATDRQISVDIPRCHQYNELMASQQGHQKLARLLKAWLNHNRAEYVYWQGLDSLAAPFLLLNFHNEAMAFACFNAFVNKYLKGFFKRDNHTVVQVYLSTFSELLSYHDPSLAKHLKELGFQPDLYAIPWFLTMFTHVLPLHKILHVWDCLLLGNEKFPLCIGLAILNQLRHELMNYNFNDCIVAFSDLPEIDIERCLRDALHFYNSTPDKLMS